MASQNFFDSASEITVALKYIPQFASRPAATGYAAGSLIFDTTDNAFYEVSNSAWAVVPLLTTVGSLADINDVDASGALDGQSLIYDASTSTWKAEVFSIASLNDVGDVNVSGVTNNQILYFDSSTSTWKTQDFNTQETYQTESFIVACSDETTDLTTGTAKATFRMPYAFTLQEVRASVTTAPVGSTIIVDINEDGTTILSTKLSIDASEKTSTTAATPPVISDSALADDAEITIDIDQVGSGTAGAGLKVALIGVRA